jgi:hypothetical protein
MRITIFVKTSSYSSDGVFFLYCTTTVQKERYLQLLYGTVGDRHSIVNNNNDDDDEDDDAMKDSQVILAEEEEEVDTRRNDDDMMMILS